VLVAIIVDPTAPVYSFQTAPATDEDIPLGCNNFNAATAASFNP
jgi:hypothetical protein